MNQYSEELKASLVVKMLPPNNVSVAQLARETGIPKDTLYTWRRNMRKGEPSDRENPPEELRSEEKFNIVLETATFNEAELGEYCRRKGLFPQQISQWRDNCKQAQVSLSPKADREKLRDQAKEIK
ncbi:MAG: transposase, partial [Gammaproteobacteria bacterium]